MKFDDDYCPSGELHDWQRGRWYREDGLECSMCGVTEAEL